MVKCSQCQQNAHVLQYYKYYCAKCFLKKQKEDEKKKKQS
jgi:hypothetical protein